MTDETERPEPGPELTKWLAEQNPAYEVTPTVLEVEHVFLREKLGINALEERVAALEAGNSPVEESASVEEFLEEVDNEED